ncbi:unnamed protein product, partial [Mesorhabditis belari]|uniref:Uncharacterized protein n=1 Tax=Mesorhabditis belari TaxID=2138241 RepID=A0AAF3EWZ0_9BILA
MDRNQIEDKPRLPAIFDDLPQYPPQPNEPLIEPVPETVPQLTAPVSNEEDPFFELRIVKDGGLHSAVGKCWNWR